MLYFSRALLERIAVSLVKYHITRYVSTWILVRVNIRTSFCWFLFAFKNLRSLNLSHQLGSSLYNWLHPLTSIGILIWRIVRVFISNKSHNFCRSSLVSVRIGWCIRSNTVCSCINYLLLNNLDIRIQNLSFFI